MKHTTSRGMISLRTVLRKLHPEMILEETSTGGPRHRVSTWLTLPADDLRRTAWLSLNHHAGHRVEIQVISDLQGFAAVTQFFESPHKGGS